MIRSVGQMLLVCKISCFRETLLLKVCIWNQPFRYLLFLVVCSIATLHLWDTHEPVQFHLWVLQFISYIVIQIWSSLICLLFFSWQQSSLESLLRCQWCDTELQKKKCHCVSFSLCRSPSQRCSAHQVSAKSSTSPDQYFRHHFFLLLLLLNGLQEWADVLVVPSCWFRVTTCCAVFFYLISCICHPQRWEGSQISGKDLFDLGREERVSWGGHCSVQSRLEQKGKRAREAEGKRKREGETEREGKGKGKRKRKGDLTNNWSVWYFFQIIVWIISNLS